MAKKALVTGITGQDGSYLAELLLHKGYEVHGIIRRSSTPNTGRIDHLLNRVQLHYGDLDDDCSLHHILEKTEPSEIYNLGAMSHVRVSFDVPEYTAQATGVSTTRLLEAMRDVCPKARFYQAGSSEMFGKVQENPQKETTPFYPRSPYGCAKVYAHWIATNYRESYGLHISNGILFNHESPRRGETFVTRKITKWIGQRLRGEKWDPLYLGNLEAKRDWGYAAEYVCAMWRMLQQETPDDYVIATGETHSVFEFLDLAIQHANTRALDCPFTHHEIRTDPALYRPAEVDVLLGDPSKAEAKLGWKPQVTFRELVKIMVDADRGHGKEPLTHLWARA